MDYVHDCHSTIDLGLGYERVPRYDQPGSSLPVDRDDTGHKTILDRKQDSSGSSANLCFYVADGVYRFSIRDTVWQIWLYITINTASLWSPIIDPNGMGNDAILRLECE